MTRGAVVDFLVAMALGAAAFVITAALAGIWLGLALRFVWLLAF